VQKLFYHAPLMVVQYVATIHSVSINECEFFEIPVFQQI